MRKGFTLVELIVTIAVAAIVMSAIGMFMISNTRMVQDTFGNTYAQADLQLVMTVLTNYISELDEKVNTFKQPETEPNQYKFIYKDGGGSEQSYFTIIFCDEYNEYTPYTIKMFNSDGKECGRYSGIYDFQVTPSGSNDSFVYHIEITGFNSRSGKLLKVESDVGIRNKR